MDNKIIHDNKLTDKTYISKAFPQYRIVPDYKGGSKQVFDDNQRVISKVIDSQVQYTFAQIKDEIIIRKTDKGRQEIRATVFEESRGITVVTFQRYTTPSGKPHETSFSFVGKEIEILYDFIYNLTLLPITGKDANSIKDKELDNVINSKEGILEFILEHQEILSEFFASELTSDDIVALGYRKKQLEIFSRLLNDANYFEDLKSKYKVGNEGLWQKFFEKNNWIFGYGLNYVFNHDIGRQVVEGYSDGGRFVYGRHEVSVLRKQLDIADFKPMRLHLPYGKWKCADGREVLFNRDYCPIWERSSNGIVMPIEPDVYVHHDDSEFYFDDGNAPYYDNNSSTVKNCLSVLNDWGVSELKPKVLERVPIAMANGDFGLLNPKGIS